MSSLGIDQIDLFEPIQLYIPIEGSVVAIDDRKRCEEEFEMSVELDAYVICFLLNRAN